MTRVTAEDAIPLVNKHARVVVRRYFNADGPNSEGVCADKAHWSPNGQHVVFVCEHSGRSMTVLAEDFVEV